MNSKQEARLNMYHAVIAYCDANNPIVLTIPAFDTALTSFRAKVSSIETTAQQEAQVISGVATDKNELRNSLCQQAADIAAVVYAFAASGNNNTLKEAVDFSKSDLRELRDDQLAPTCQNIHDAANTNLAALAPYGITAPMLSSFQDLIDDYSDAVPAPRNAAALRKTYAAALKTLFSEADEILKEQMDKTAVQFKTANEEFYNTYKNNRIILDPAVSSTQIAGVVRDQWTNNPVAGVAIQVDGESYATTTNGNGEYTLKIPEAGEFNITFTKSGYVSKTEENVEVTIGQETDLDVIINQIPS